MAGKGPGKFISTTVMGPSAAGVASRKSPIHGELVRDYGAHRPILGRCPPGVNGEEVAAAAGAMAEGTRVIGALEAVDVP